MTVPQLQPANIALTLSQQARQQPDQLAVICPQGRDLYGHVRYLQLSCRQLERESDQRAWALQRLGLRPGMRTVLMVPPGLDFFSLTFALFKLGAVPVLIDPGMGLRNIRNCLQQVQPEAFIGSGKAHAARLLFGWGKNSLRHRLTTGSIPLPDSARLCDLLTVTASEPWPCHRPTTDAVAAILFTSGSTGPPKGAVYRHSQFNAQIAALKQLYNIQPGEQDLCTFPLFALFAPALGMTAIVPDMDASRPGQVNAQRLFEAFDDFRIDNLFGSPALLRRLADAGRHQGRQLGSLKRIISAGAPVPASLLEDLSSLLKPETQIFTPYGATEALPVASIGSHEILADTRILTDAGRGICVGRPLAGLQLAIIAIDDAPIRDWRQARQLPVGQIGEICVRGLQVTDSYWQLPDATAAAKIPCADGGFYHRMGDVGYLDESGRLWFCGRKNHRVELTAADADQPQTLFSIPCEAPFNRHPAVARTALVGCRQQGRQRALLCIETRRPTTAPAREQIAAELRQIQQQHRHCQAISGFLFHPGFPVDVRHNAKIFREKLALWATRQLS